MSDPTPVAAEADVPVNPYSLLEAVNDTSEDARTGWFVFLGLMTYLLVAVAGISHKELLLARDVPLPILQVSVDLQRFFLFAPIVLCFLHFGLLMQHAMLARKLVEFDTALRGLELAQPGSHPLRLELHSYFFSQALAGPRRSPLMSGFLHTQAWLTLVALPVLLLLYIQVAFLAFHDAEITWAHRLTLMVDIGLLGAIGFFLIRSDTSFFHALYRTMRHHPVTFTFTALILATVLLVSLLAATIPGEWLDRNAPKPSLAWRQSINRAMPLLRDPHSDSLFGFRRNLVVMDADLVDDRSVAQGQVSLNLRGRDLRNARLDRSDLHQADFTGAVLDGASLTGADLRGALMSCPDLNEMLLTGNRAEAQCTSLRNANLARARATGARIAGADLTGARMEGIYLDDAELSHTLLRGADLSSAHLERADLSGGVHAQGANFLLAQMQGADLTGANLHGSDLSGAGLQGALLTNARMHGASLREAELDAADLGRARLAAADLVGARVFGADLRGAHVWQAMPPARELAELADVTDVTVQPLEDGEAAVLKAVVEAIEDPLVKSRVRSALASLLEASAGHGWKGSAEAGQWQELIRNGMQRNEGDAYRMQLTGFLGNVSCKPRWANASVATGVAKRALGMRFRGNNEALYSRLGGSDCPASATLSKRLMRDLSAAVDSQKGIQTASGSNAAPPPAAPPGLVGPIPVTGGR